MKKNIVCGLFFAAIVLPVWNARSEVFLSSGNAIKSLVVASNETVIISSIRSSSMYSYGVVGQISIQGSTNSYEFDTGPSSFSPNVLSGPAVLTFPDYTGSYAMPVCVSFNRLTGTSIHSVVLNDKNTNQIYIPSGQTCHFFPPIRCDSADAIFQISDGTNTISVLGLYGSEEFTGPVTIELTQDWGSGTIVSYYFTDNFISLPNGVVQGGTGSFNITVEKSTDLTNWHTTIFQPVTDDQKAFYRLKLSK